MFVRTLTTEDVLEIHNVLVRDFAASPDPIAPAGLRSRPLLESAVSRQLSGFLGHYKYPDPIDNAATLGFGVCQNHAFFNGNKRTSLVCMLVHLDRNKLTLYKTNQDDLYKLMLSIADHTVGLDALPDRTKRSLLRRRTADSEVTAIAHWLRQRTAKVARGEYQITYTQLRRCLNQFDYSFGSKKNNSIDVVKLETERYGLFNLRSRKIEKRIGNIPYPGERKDVGVEIIKRVRTLCHLRAEDGIDSDAFYFETSPIDAFVNRYRAVLRRLART
jgi:death-on-curing protein